MRVGIPKIAVFLVCVLALYWFIPNVYNRATRMDKFSLSGVFSPIYKSFIVWESTPDEMVYKDEQGTLLDKVEAQTKMPFIFSGNVNKWGGFPLNIDAQTFSYEEAKKNTQSMRISPRYVFSEVLAMNVLFETAPVGTQFPVPKDVVLFKENRLEFITMNDGIIDTEKSEAFSASLKNAGLVFPIKRVATNPSPLKSFDEGMMLIDAQNNLFHLKMLKDKPFVHNMHLTIPETPLYMTLEENPRKRYYGLIVTDRSVYLYTYANELVKLPLNAFDPTKHALMIRMSPLYQTIIQSDVTDKTQPLSYIATDIAFQPLHVKEQVSPQTLTQQFERLEKGLSFLTPFTLRQFSSSKGGIVFDFKGADNMLFAVMGIVFALVVYIGYVRLRHLKLNVLSLCLIVFSGIPALIALIIFGDVGTYQSKREQV